MATACCFAGLFFLRPYPRFWRVLSIATVVVAATAVAAFGGMLAWRGAGAGVRSGAAAWAALASLRILLAPLPALAFFVSAVVAPSLKPRLVLLGASTVEVFVFCGHFLLALTIGRAE